MADRRIWAALAMQAVLLAALLCLSTVATASDIRTAGAYTITFYNNGETDGSATGVMNWSTQAEDDVVASALQWTSRLSNIPSRQVQVHFFWNDFYDCITTRGVLGSTYNPIVGFSNHAYSQTEYVWRQGGSYSSTVDARIIYDNVAAGYAWNFGTGNPSGSQIDFRSVVTHEFGHTVGLDTTYNHTTDTWWLGGLTAWDGFLRDASSGGDQPNRGGSGTPGNFNELANPDYFVGANAEAANGGNPVPVFAPASWMGGSSLVHVDSSIVDLMDYSIGTGTMRRAPSAIDAGIMKDLGWTVVAVPEPATGAFLALGALGLARLRRKRAA